MSLINQGNLWQLVHSNNDIGRTMRKLQAKYHELDDAIFKPVGYWNESLDQAASPTDILHLATIHNEWVTGMEDLEYTTRSEGAYFTSAEIQDVIWMIEQALRDLRDIDVVLSQVRRRGLVESNVLTEYDVVHRRLQETHRQVTNKLPRLMDAQQHMYDRR